MRLDEERNRRRLSDSDVLWALGDCLDAEHESRALLETVDHRR